uniref:AAA domain-containing protein n=1 Tax=Schistosoma mansoni TaxID=6183 RepID=A0A5K4F1N5_SCHMA
MGFFSAQNHGRTMKSLFIQSFFPFFELYNEIPLKPIESKHKSDPLHVLTSFKEFWSVVFTNPSSIWPQIRLWWYNRFPSTTSSPDLQPKFKFNVDAVKIIQIIISLVGIGISIRLMFYLIEQMNPTMKEKRECRKRAQAIFKAIGLKSIPKLNDYEVCVAVNLVDPQVLNTTWNSIGGLDSIIHEIKYGVLEPLRAKRLLSINSRLLQPPKGVLLYGPPGCGKTLLARAMAHAAHANFLNLQISTLVNMWYGETQKYVEATFSLAEKIQPTIIFIDELDSFLTARSHLDNEATRMMKTQFMALWDGLITNNNNTQIVIVGATNRPGDLDQAILRRLSFKINVPLPNANQRKHILKVLLKDDPVAKALNESDFTQIASKTEGLSGSDLSELCRKAAFACLWSFLEGGDTQASLLLTVDHFTQALHKYMNDKIKLAPLGNTNFFPLG